jgi:uncharacterized protein YdhG (YjbR/CyaY superfamily)
MRQERDVAAYIAETPPKARKALKAMRSAIKTAVPGLTERIAYGVPVFELDGKYLLYIAAFTNHVSVYPVTKGLVAKHGSAIARFRSGKGTLRFPLDKPVPAALIRRLARTRLEERRSKPRA